MQALLVEHAKTWDASSSMATSTESHSGLLPASASISFLDLAVEQTSHAPEIVSQSSPCKGRLVAEPRALLSLNTEGDGMSLMLDAVPRADPTAAL
jgi:hypothetical protein